MLTGTHSEAASYEFTTLTCIPGIIHYNDTKIQLLDLPGIIEGASEGKGRGRQVKNLNCNNIELPLGWWVWTNVKMTLTMIRAFSILSSGHCRFQIIRYCVDGSRCFKSKCYSFSCNCSLVVWGLFSKWWFLFCHVTVVLCFRFFLSLWFWIHNITSFPIGKLLTQTILSPSWVCQRAVMSEEWSDTYNLPTALAPYNLCVCFLKSISIKQNVILISDKKQYGYWILLFLSDALFGC